MSFLNDLYQNVQCCFDNDNHVAIDPILLPCGGNSCKNCIINQVNSDLKCFKCNENHKKNDLVNQNTNTFVQVMIQETFLKDLIEDLKSRFKKSVQSINEMSPEQLIEFKIDVILNDIDIRIESIVDELHKLRQEFQNDLNEIKEKLEKSVINGELKSCQKIFKNVKNEDFKYDYADFIEKQNILRNFQKKLKNYQSEIKELSFCSNEKCIDKSVIGELMKPFVQFKKLVSNKNIQIYTHEINGILTLKNKIILNDCNAMKIFDSDWNFMKTSEKYETDPIGCFCSDNYGNIYIEVFSRGKIVVLDADMNFLKEFDADISNEPSAMQAEMEENGFILRLFVTSCDQNNLFVITSSLNKKDSKTKTVGIDSPREIILRDDKLYVLSYTGYDKKRDTCKFNKFKYGSNCIFVLDKSTQQILKKIEIKNWLCPNGLYLDEYLNIVTTAFEISDDKFISNNRYLYTIDQNGFLLHKIELFDIEYPNISFTKDKIINWNSRAIKMISFNRVFFNLLNV